MRRMLQPSRLAIASMLADPEITSESQLGGHSRALRSPIFVLLEQVSD